MVQRGSLRLQAGHILLASFGEHRTLQASGGRIDGGWVQPYPETLSDKKLHDLLLPFLV